MSDAHQLKMQIILCALAMFYVMQFKTGRKINKVKVTAKLTSAGHPTYQSETVRNARLHILLLKD